MEGSALIGDKVHDMFVKVIQGYIDTNQFKKQKKDTIVLNDNNQTKKKDKGCCILI